MKPLKILKLKNLFQKIIYKEIRNGTKKHRSRKTLNILDKPKSIVNLIILKYLDIFEQILNSQQLEKK